MRKGGGGIFQVLQGKTLFTWGRKGCLEKSILYKIGLTKERIQVGDNFLFHQLLLTRCDVAMSGIRGDTSNAYYYKVDKFSNIYGMQLGLGGSYGYKFVNIYMDDLIQWYGLVQHDGVCVGGGGHLGLYIGGEQMENSTIV